MSGSYFPIPGQGAGAASWNIPDYGALAAMPNPTTSQGITVPGATAFGATPGMAGVPGVGVGAGAGGTPGMGMLPQQVGFGWNMGTGQLALGALTAGANIWSAMEAQNMAKKTFAFNRDLANANLNNQIRAYNTQLEDRARTRAYTESGQGGFNEQEYVERNRARR